MGQAAAHAIDRAFESFPEIETERLLLRELTPDDAGDLFQALGDDEVTRYYELATCRNVQEVADLIDFFAESFDVERSIRWAIARKSDERVIGSCGYVWLRPHRGEISYELARAQWRRGYMGEAVEAMLEFGFEQLALNRIEALVMRDNLASAGLLRSLGFSEEGLLREHDFFKDQFHDMRMFSLLQREFSE